MLSSHRKIALLMGTHNGAAFLDEQLDSLAHLTEESIDIYVRDDGSSDKTVDLLHSYSKRWRKGGFHIEEGDRLGFAENFRTLICNPRQQYDYFCFCDQDDVWQPDKISVAIRELEKIDPNTPALYCSRTKFLHESSSSKMFSPLFRKELSFKNALVQSIAGGNTMVFDATAWNLLVESARRTRFVSHDWWAYIIITGAGGIVRYDPIPRIYYRQHEGNQVGMNMSWKSKFQRFVHITSGGWSHWSDLNVSGLEACRDLLTDDAQQTLEQFKRLRAAKRLVSLTLFLKSGLYRQTSFGTLSMYLAILLRRF